MRVRCAVVLAAVWCAAAGGPAFGQERSPEVMGWTIDGQRREALVYPPRDADKPAPVLLAFHGHGGTMRHFARAGFRQEWPEAIVVFPQGLPTATLRDPEGKRPGWQGRPGGNGDRDLKFVDAILKTLRETYKVDDRRVHATGHSNGGAFTYLLWAARGEEFAAVAPSSAPGALLIATAKDLRPLSVLHLAGEKDEIVSFASQERAMEECRRRLGCEEAGKEWAKAGTLVGTLYPSPKGTPFVSVIHPGGHTFPTEAPGLIVKFFKEQASRERAGESGSH
jgi:polyhydroxybutyrate depolymerase